MADGLVTSDKLTSQSAVRFSHITRTSHNMTFKVLWRRKVSLMSWWSRQSYFDEEKPCQCLEKVIKATLMKKSHVDVLVKSSKLPWCIKALSMSWKKFKASSMAWWSHWSYFDEVKPHQCIGEVIKAALMKKSLINVLVKSPKLLWCIKASSMSWKSLQSLVKVLVKSLKLLCQAGLQYIKNRLYQSGALLLSSNQLARPGVWQCNSCIVVDEV